jgi:hypothetical protein
LYDRNRHGYLSQIVRRIIGLRSLYQADSFDERLELVRRG